MAHELFWFYDVAALGIILITIYCGGKRGFMRSAVLVILMAVSFAASRMISTVGAPVIYEKFLQPRIIAALNEASEKTDPLSVVSGAVSGGGYGVEMTDPEIKGVIGLDGDFFSNIASEIKNNGASDSADDIRTGMESTVTDRMLTYLIGDVVSPETLKEVLAQVSGAENGLRTAVDVFLRGNRPETADAVEKMVVAPAVKSLLEEIIWAVSMIILTIASRFIANAFESVNKIPIIGPVNILAGGILGFAEGALIVFLIAQVVRFVLYLTGDSLMFLNNATVDKTYIFKFMMNPSISAIKDMIS